MIEPNNLLIDLWRKAVAFIPRSWPKTSLICQYRCSRYILERMKWPKFQRIEPKSFRCLRLVTMASRSVPVLGAHPEKPEAARKRTAPRIHTQIHAARRQESRIEGPGLPA